MVQKKLRKPVEKEFERVDWAKYKTEVIFTTRIEAVPFIGIRTTQCLLTGFGELNLRKIEDRRFIRETQRAIRPGFIDKLQGIFETAVVEIASYMKMNDIGPGDRGFEAEVIRYAESILSALKAAEAAMLSLMPKMSAEKRAEFDARFGKCIGGYKN